MSCMNLPGHRTPRRLMRSIVIGVIAGLAVTYGEYRAIERAPAFSAAYLVALSSDLKRVLDANSDAATARLQAMY